MARHRVIWTPEKGRFASTPEIQVKPYDGSDFTIHLAVMGTNETEENQALTYISDILAAGARALRDDGPDGTDSVTSQGLAEIGLGIDTAIKGSGW